MSILKDKFYGLVFATALGDCIGTYVDLLQQEGILTKVKSPLEAPIHIRGFWNEMTTLMLVNFESLFQKRLYIDLLKEALETGAFTSTGTLSDLNSQTVKTAIGEITQEEGLMEEPCNHNSDCLILTGALAMFYHKNYELFLRIDFFFNV